MRASDFRSNKRIRYAVVGLGYIAQTAILPAFTNASANSELKALVSSDREKLEELGRAYGIRKLYQYEDYERLLHSDEIDAVYICVPNSLHFTFALKAAEAGKHVLCETPMAVTVNECERLIGAAEFQEVKLMAAYRLHFEEANLSAIEIAHSGAIGEPMVFQALYTRPIRANDIHARRDLGGGSLYDLGLYCINAARNVFREEPLEVFGYCAKSGNPQLAEIDELTSGILRFSGGRVATFTCGFGEAETSHYHIIGRDGDLRVSPAFSLGCDYMHELQVGGQTRRTVFPKRDHFAPEILYFSKCILEDMEPEPSGREGLADIRVINSLIESADRSERQALEGFSRHQRPGMRQEITCPPLKPLNLVHLQYR